MLMAIGIGLTGPMTFVPLTPSLELSIVGVCFCGVGYGVMSVSATCRSKNEAESEGFADDPETNAFLAGIWTGSYYLGNLVGPTAAGYMIEYKGFRWTSLLFFVGEVFNSILSIFCLIFKLFKNE